MEFISGPSGNITPDPGYPISAEQLAKTAAAMELFWANTDRVGHFMRRVTELGRSGADTVITLVDADDPVGGILADNLVPNCDWQQFRDRGEMPIARGLAEKDAIHDFLKVAGFDEAAAELQGTDQLRIVVITEGIALALDARPYPG